MATHTPGPWAYDGRFTVTIPDIGLGSCSFRVQPNDARLIATAPELLDAVKALRDGAYGNPSYPVENDQIDEAADAAIAKAEGRV